jgi:hypothetical protein
MIGDHYRDLWKDRHWYPNTTPMPDGGGWTISAPQVSRAEFEDLKRQVLEMKELLKRAKAYDEATGQPDCEIDDKMDLLRKIAKAVGVDLDDVLLRAKPAAAPVDPMEAVREISRGDL